jgi:hypothetical protein
MTPVVEFMSLFPEFRAPSWDAWRAVLARLGDGVREFWAAVGRGGGKSRIAALLACAFATRDYTRAPGESIYVGVFAPDRKQAAITLRYVRGLLNSVPALAGLIASETRESIDLAHGVVIEVVTASLAAPRGRAYALAIVEEAAFLPTDQSANPDLELLRAIRPALARVPGSLLAVVSSPYARRGELWRTCQRHQARPDPAVVVVQASTLALNPTFDRQAVETAYVEDPASAAAEYGGEFRSDLEAFVTRDAVAAVTDPGCLERAPAIRGEYVAFVDPSGGSADSMTLAVACGDGDGSAVLAALREAKPPFSPEAVVAEFAALLATYRVATVHGDRYGGEWPREVFRRHRIEYVVSERSKSELYQALLPLLNSRRVALLDVPRLQAQLAGLERRVSRGGRDSIDHAPGGHDDVANAAAGALVLAAAPPRVPWQVWGGGGPDPRSADQVQADADDEARAAAAASGAYITECIRRTGVHFPGD